ncbi:hypothetical protein I79_000142 [Cricetulus griseus]|uniref:Uncharacterized protein n=1 Tax=Cricetulus griseus TaxID=10029 RepID=G3GRJ6_CRIGR|nr:hypothetical protein I79_000142 [Cricetulus griseus]
MQLCSLDSSGMRTRDYREAGGRGHRARGKGTTTEGYNNLRHLPTAKDNYSFHLLPLQGPNVDKFHEILASNLSRHPLALGFHLIPASLFSDSFTKDMQTLIMSVSNLT